jgi:hypothetical protein
MRDIASSCDGAMMRIIHIETIEVRDSIQRDAMVHKQTYHNEVRLYISIHCVDDRVKYCQIAWAH